MSDEWLSINLRRAILCAFTLGLLSLIGLCMGPILNAIEIGLDEHYELTKGLLWSRGFELYDQIWSDQPPLLTVLLGTSFTLLGESIGVARALAGLFGLSLLAAFWAITIRRGGLLVAALASAFLLGAPQVLSLGVSVMLEVPTIGTSLWALWAVHKWQEGHQSRWLVLSGVVLGIALQLKLTAIVIAPAIAAEILLGTPHGAWRERILMAISGLGAWGGSVALALAGLIAIFGTTPLHVLQSSHFSSGVATAVADPVPITGFWPMLVSQHPDVIGTAALGLTFLLLNRDGRRWAFCLITLATVTVLYRYHRPFWEYYYLHVALPLAWLSGYGIAGLLRYAWSLPGREWPSWRTYFATCLLLAVVGGFNGLRFLSVVTEMSRLPRVAQSALVNAMRAEAHDSDFIYTRSTAYAFHAGVSVIPELATLPRKRFTSGQITDGAIWRIVEGYQPRMLLLTADPLEPAVLAWIDRNYTQTYFDGTHSLYLQKVHQ